MTGIAAIIAQAVCLHRGSPLAAAISI